MTENQLMTTDIQFSVNYTPSKIIIENEEQLDGLISQMTEFYETQVFNDSNVPDAKEARKQLNKYIKAMEDKRKEIGREFSKPLKDFEGIMKGYVQRLQTVADDIGEGINKFEEEEKAIRFEKIKEEVASIAALLNIEPEAIEISSTWLKKGAFNSKGEVKGKTSDEIKDKLKIAAMERDRIAADKATVTDYAELAGLDPYAWSTMVDQGWNVADIKEKIKQSVEDKRLREAEAEKARLAKEEHDAALAKLAQTQTENGTTIDKETGEIIYSPEEEKMTVVLRLTGDLNQMNQLNNYLIENNIKVEQVG